MPKNDGGVLSALVNPKLDNTFELVPSGQIDGFTGGDGVIILVSLGYAPQKVLVYPPGPLARVI
jgi:hypothetical protein